MSCNCPISKSRVIFWFSGTPDPVPAGAPGIVGADREGGRVFSTFPDVSGVLGKPIPTPASVEETSRPAESAMALLIALFFLFQSTKAQQISGNSISDFVGQLTNLFNQNGGLGSVLQQGPDGGFGLYPATQKPFPQRYPYPNDRPYPVAPPYAPYPRPPPGPQGQSLFSALASIARYDDLRCVPRLLCEVTSGSKPGQIGSQQSTAPLTTKDSLLALLTVVDFIDNSPLLVFGRAALLGYSSRGNSRACLTAYPTCPRDPDALVDYLNNHHGGFFRYFSWNNGETNNLNHRPPNYGQYQYPYRPPYYQRYAGKYTAAKDHFQERILVRPPPFNSYDQREHDKLVFPTRGVKQLHFPQQSDSYTASYKPVRTNGYLNPNYGSVTPVPFFPDRTGTGKLLLDNQGVHYAPPQNLINFRDQRSVKFPGFMNFPKT
ncbi:uncharacterized protein LOC106661003 isoform X2 [Cimex lectularius]|uniref:Uncharacterized protein n=1 Tax=Cimex lectularius TaxID=79782 RepID=A0A8I6R6Y8_CIMLE|nr:uncharacterized protein LOC106661003 isoform X2 [Cimex lectularius]